MSRIEIGPNGEIELSPDMLEHIGLPSGGTLIYKKLADGSVILRRRRRFPRKPVGARPLISEEASPPTKRRR